MIKVCHSVKTNKQMGLVISFDWPNPPNCLKFWTFAHLWHYSMGGGQKKSFCFHLHVARLKCVFSQISVKSDELVLVDLKNSFCFYVARLIYVFSQLSIKSDELVWKGLKNSFYFHVAKLKCIFSQISIKI